MTIKSEDCYLCRKCCKFFEEDKQYGPFFSDSEKKLVDDILGPNNNFVFNKKRQIYQGKLVRSKIKSVPADPEDRPYACIFLDKKTHKCSIYAQRPFDCKFWPYIVIRNKSGVVELRCFHKVHCDSLKQTSDKILFKSNENATIYMTSNKMKKFLKENAGLILDYKKDDDYFYMTHHVADIDGV